MSFYSLLNLATQVPPEYAKAVCNLFAQLGSRGVTFFSSSGDYG